VYERYRQTTDGRATANSEREREYSEREREFTFAKNAATLLAAGLRLEPPLGEHTTLARIPNWARSFPLMLGTAGRH